MAPDRDHERIRDPADVEMEPYGDLVLGNLRLIWRVFISYNYLRGPLQLVHKFNGNDPWEGNHSGMARIDDYRESFRLASEELRNADLREVARRAEVEIVSENGSEGCVRVPFFGKPCVVRVVSEVDVLWESDEAELPLPEKILILHYLLHASGKPLSGDLITFRQIPDGQFYYEAFQRRARDPFLSTFGRNVELFKSCGLLMGGRPVDAGDFGMVFSVLPRIPIQLVLWKGDEEFTAEAGILFDSVIQHDLSAEDIAVLSGMLVYRLMGLSRNQGASTGKS